MTKQFGRLVLILTVLGCVALPAVADEGASVSGHVKDSGGKPQMGALVEVFSPPCLRP